MCAYAASRKSRLTLARQAVPTRSDFGRFIDWRVDVSISGCRSNVTVNGVDVTGRGSQHRERASENRDSPVR